MFIRQLLQKSETKEASYIILGIIQWLSKSYLKDKRLSER